MPAQALTALPEAGTPTVTSVNDQVTVEAANRADYGTWITEFRAVGDTTWTTFDSSVPYDVAADSRSGFTMGARYEFRTYNRTEHTVSDSSQPVSHVFPLEAPTGLTVEDRSTTSVTLSWIDNSSAEGVEGFVLQYRRAGRPDAWDPAEEVSATSTQATANGLIPDTDYQFRVFVRGRDYRGYSDPVTISTLDPGFPAEAVPPKGWHVVVVHSDGTRVVVPVIGSPNWEPALNDFPRVRVPVAPDDKWLAEGFENCQMMVWKDGSRLPIDSLVDVRVEPSQYTLVGRGGEELLETIQVQYQEQAAHVAAHDIIEAGGYEANVDDPNATTSSGVVLQRATTGAELSAIVGQLPATDPVGVRNGRLSLLQSCWWRQDSALFGEAAERVYHNDYSLDSAVSFGNNPGLEGSTTVEPSYEIPGEHAKVALRVGANPPGGTTPTEVPGVEVLVGGQTAWLRDEDLWTRGDGQTWLKSPAIDVDLYADRATEITVRNRGGGTIDLHVDALVVYDDRYDYSWGSQTATGVHVGPELYPPEVDVDLGEIAAGRLCLAAAFNADFSSTAPPQAIAISSDNGATWTEATGEEFVSADFSDNPSTTLRLRVTFGRTGTGGGPAPPASGHAGMSLSSLSVNGVLDSTPTLVGNAYQSTRMGVLQQIADFGDYIFEVRRDGGTYSVEWCEPGQRTDDRSERLTDYSVDKVASEQFERVVVRGSGRPVSGESFTADAGNWVDLTQSNIIEGQTTVRDDSGTSYDYGTDYQIDPLNGRIQATAGGALTDGSSYLVDYQYKVTGEYTSSGAGSNPRTRFVDLPAANTVSRCEQLAVTIGDQVDDPYRTADVVIPDLPPDLSLVAALSLESVPLSQGGLEVMQMEQKPEEVKLTLGSRSPLEETISRLQRQLATVANKV